MENDAVTKNPTNISLMMTQTQPSIKMCFRSFGSQNTDNTLSFKSIITLCNNSIIALLFGVNTRDPSVCDS